MALVPRKSLFDMDRFFDDFWVPTELEPAAGDFFAPRVEVRDVNDHYEITAELPGVKRNDIHVHVKDGVLTLEAEATREDKEEKEGKVIRSERRYGKFMRSFSLGKEVAEKDIKANFSDGILTLQAPKAQEKAAQRHRIEVS